MGKKKGTNGMMKKITKRLWEKKNSKKGFTLVELIVVLVILAILAAIMVPALLGWIDKAKEKEASLEARSVYLAVQTLASEEYGKSNPNRANISREKVLKLADVTDTANIEIVVYYDNALPTSGSIPKNAFKVVGLKYTNKDFTETPFEIGNVSSTNTGEIDSLTTTGG